MTTARQIAVDVLHRSRSREGFVAELIEAALANPERQRGGDVTPSLALGVRQDISPQDRRFLTQLVNGVVRRKGTLDALLKPFIQIPFHAVQPRVWDVLHLGAFQLCFLTHIPKHAAVNETVELATHVGSPKAKGFVNGIMRRVSELVTDEFTDRPGADAVPMDLANPGRESGGVTSTHGRESGGVASTHGRQPGGVTSTHGRESGGVASTHGREPGGVTSTPGRQPGGVASTHGRQRGGVSDTPGLASGVRQQYRKLTRPVLPDPATAPDAYFAAAFSFPKWLADRWLGRYGPDETTRLGFWFNAPPPLWIRVNKLHNDRETYRLRLAASLIDAETGEHPQSLRFPEHHAIRELPGFDTGDFAVQDHSSMLVASALGVQPGMRVLDLCAAPGGKTTHLAELMDNRGVITACDTDPKRLETVTALCQRLGIKGVRTAVVPENGEPPPGPFDAALVDVPCTNTGVLGRRPEVRWRLKPSEFEFLIRLQTRLLFQALERVKPGGVVVYSTCSIEPDENENVVKGVLRGMRNVKLEAEHHSVPGKPSDGGYWARLRRG